MSETDEVRTGQSPGVDWEDLVVAGLLLGLGVVLVVLAPEPGVSSERMGDRLGPGGLGRVGGWVIVVASALLIVQELRRGLVTYAPRAESDQPRGGGLRARLLPPAFWMLTFAYSFAIVRLSYLVATPLFALLGALMLGEGLRWRVPVIAVVITVCIYLPFQWLGVSL